MTYFLKRYEAVAFVFLMAVSLGLHLYRVSLPAAPVFDEAYFTTYAADNATGKIFFDVHPPLGKWLYALPLLFYQPAVLSGANYVTFGHDAVTGTLQTNYNPAPFGNFPYVPLRLTSVFFGLLLIAGFYLLVRTLAGPVAAVAGTFLLVFENALLLDTRLVLMDGMFLAFGLWSLYFFLKERPRPLLAGVLFGLALSVKLTAIVFIGPVLIVLIIGWRELPREKIKPHWGKFAITALAVLALCEFGLSDVIIHPHAVLNYDIENFGWPMLKSIGGAFSQVSWLTAAIKSTIVNAILMLYGYTMGGISTLQSPWYTWPFMWKPIEYTRQIALIGNPFVWLSSTAAVIGALWLLIKNGVKRSFQNVDKPLLLLVGGYVLCTAPFFTIVQRSTFLYHYFPALLFAIALAGVFMGKLIEKDDFASRLALVAIVVLTVVGFLIVAPHTYGV
jgi:dolichyl-phosphate-mannose--protein O-mannosyl transferase